MKTYETYSFGDEIFIGAVPRGKVDCFNWEEESFSRPETDFQMFFKKNKGIFVNMKTNEKNLRITCEGRDGNCWEDSCMEFFFQPFSKEDGYINFEITPKGAYLSAFGVSRENRVFLKELTDIVPEVNCKITDEGWELSLFIPCSLIEDVFKKEFTAKEGTYKGNFFKCGDKTEKPHYGSFSPMGELPPGFHNPELFADIIVSDYYLRKEA